MTEVGGGCGGEGSAGTTRGLGAALGEIPAAERGYDGGGGGGGVAVGAFPLAREMAGLRERGP